MFTFSVNRRFSNTRFLCIRYYSLLIALPHALCNNNFAPCFILTFAHWRHRSALLQGHFRQFEQSCSLLVQIWLFWKPEKCHQLKKIDSAIFLLTDFHWKMNSNSGKRYFSCLLVRGRVMHNGAAAVITEAQSPIHLLWMWWRVVTSRLLLLLACECERESVCVYHALYMLLKIA